MHRFASRDGHERVPDRGMAGTMGDVAPEPETRPSRFGPWRREVRAFVELLALTGIAVAQPTLDLLANNSALFVSVRASKLETIALACFIVLFPPVALWALEVLAGLVLPRARRYVHALIAAGVLAVIAMEVLKQQTDLAPVRLLVLAVPIGLAGGLVILRIDVVRLFLRYLAIAPAIFLALFLFASPVTAVVFEGGTAATKNVRVGKPNRIVMIVMDEFPIRSILDGTGQVDAALYPNLAAFAADSTWFRNSTTVAPYTEAAVPAILTGNYPTGADTPPVSTEYPDNLFTFLGDRYRMNVHEAITQLCPPGICAETTSGTSDGFGELVDETYSLWEDFASPRRAPPPSLSVFGDPISAGDGFVESLRPSRQPELDFLHVMLPHQPWHLRGTGQDDGYRKRVIGLDAKLHWINAWDALSARQRHLLQLQEADRLLGQIVRKLRAIGAYDDSLIVVTADHGVAFDADHSIRGVGNTNYPEILWTPLFVRIPGQARPAIDDRPVRAIDVLPTIADVIDAKLPWKVDGRSVFGTPRRDANPRVFNWIFSEVNAPPGSDYTSFPGAAGFQAALAGRASDAGGPTKLRLYRIGPFGALIGRRAAPLVTATTAGARATVPDRERFDDVDPNAASIPWAWLEGRLDTGPTPEPMAITVNGVIAGLTQSSPRGAGSADFWATLSPDAFRRGQNVVGVYLIRGTPASPQLERVRLRE